MKINRTCRAGIAMVILMGAHFVVANEPVLMNDAQLELITAGSNSDAEGEVARIGVDRTTRAGTRILANGTIDVVEAYKLSQGMLSLTDSAQSHLRSLINVNAVNSEVNILLNLNISIDSNIGEIHQSNLNGILTPPRPGG